MIKQENPLKKYHTTLYKNFHKSYINLENLINELLYNFKLNKIFVQNNENE